MNKEETVLLNRAMGERVREIRREKGWEVGKVAERAGLGAFAWKKIEAGAVHVTYDSLIAICIALEIHPKEFMDFDYLGAARGIVDKAVGRTSFEGLQRFFDALEARGRVSRSLRQELSALVKMVHLTKHGSAENGDRLFFALDGAMLISEVKNRTPFGFLTPGNFFFDVGWLLEDGSVRYVLRPLKDTVLYVISGDAMLGMVERQKTLKVLLRKIWGEMADMGSVRKSLLGFKGKARVAYMYQRYPGWANEVPEEGLARYVDLRSSFHSLHKKYKEDLKRLPGGDKNE